MTTVSTKPYLIRAIWEWCVDQGFTPFLAARVDAQTRVPPGYDRDGQIVLNIAPDATGQLSIANDFITFQARFNGAAHSLVIPVANVIAVYARENGQGMAFEPEAGEVEDERTDEVEDMADGASTQSPGEAPGDGRGGDDKPPRSRGGHLKVVK